MFTRSTRAFGAGVLIVSVALLVVAPSTFGASAVDQYSEGIPTAGGQKPTSDAAGGSAGTATIPPTARARLDKSSKGSAAEKAAQLTAPTGPHPTGSGDSDSGGEGDGMGLLLPLILAATLALGIGIFIARRRLGATPT
jgi:hypothetical protein